MKNVILNNHLKNFSLKYHYENKSESEQFEYFINYLVAKQSVEIDGYNVGLISTGDSAPGIDGVCVIIDGELYYKLEEVKEIMKKGKHDVKLIFIQAKTTDGININYLSGFATLVQECFEFETKDTFTDELNNYVDVLKEVYNNSIRFNGNPTLEVLYVATGKIQKDENIDIVLNNGYKKFENMSLFNKIRFDVCGIDYILDCAERINKNNICEFSTLDTLEYQVAPASRFIVALLEFDEYRKIIVDENGNLKNIFDDNIRGNLTQNKTPNLAMTKTIKGDKPESFCLLNNGVTIVAEKLDFTKPKIRIENYQIVNGCQTSNVLFENLNVDKIKEVKLLVKIIATEDEDFVKDIVKSTNNQNSVSLENLESLRQFHKELEKYYDAMVDVYKFNLYYERRQNQFINQQEKDENKISVEMLAKTFSSVVLERPEVVASNYGQLKEKFGSEIFSDDHKKQLYYICGLLFIVIVRLLDNKDLDKRIEKFRFHIALLCKYIILNDYKLDINENKFFDDIVKLIIGESMSGIFQKAYNITYAYYQKHKYERKTTEKRRTTEDLISIVNQ